MRQLLQQHPEYKVMNVARGEQNLGAADVELSPADVRALEEASERIEIRGARYPEFHERLTGR